MPSTAITQKGQRGLRVKLGGSILALLVLENGRQIRGRMSQLSINGGLLSLEQPLDEGIRVTVLFHIGNTSIRCRAQMLFPMWATKGCLQPFRYLELPEASHASLNRELENLVRSGAPQEQEPQEPESREQQEQAQEEHSE
ncbi:MAG: hypothetical protein WBW53_01580 [Terriglobales bacterium]